MIGRTPSRPRISARPEFIIPVGFAFAVVSLLFEADR
jgi:hypothetical protein